MVYGYIWPKSGICKMNVSELFAMTLKVMTKPLEL